MVDACLCSRKGRLHHRSYADHEEFYLSIAAEAGLNGWELDRLMFNFQSEFLTKV